MSNTNEGFLFESHPLEVCLNRSFVVSGALYSILNPLRLFSKNVLCSNHFTICNGKVSKLILSLSLPQRAVSAGSDLH